MKKKIRKIFTKYKWFLVILAGNLTLLLLRPSLGFYSLSLSWKYVLEMLSVVSLVFIMMGLMDVWIPKETMMKYLGKGVKFKGGLFAFLLGSFSSGPFYAAFPISGMFLEKGVSLANIFLFLSACSTAKIPMALFESDQLGIKFTGIRFVLNTMGIIFLALVIDKTTSKQEQEIMHQKVCEISEK